MEERTQRILFRDMLRALEDARKCKQEYHELGEVLGLIAPSDIAYGYPDTSEK